MARKRVANSRHAELAYTAKDFFLDDIPRTLFPLTTNRFLVELGSIQLTEFADNLINNGGSFLPQRRVYANKDEVHLRRTVKLDPVAEFYLYHLIFKNRTRFRRPYSEDRIHFGYRFEEGRPVSASRSYAEFKSAIASANIYMEEFLYFDITSYFNNVYHHDLHAWFSAIEPDDPADIGAFGKFLREINAGRSLDCLPQGLYPSKMIGNDFLRFIENSSSIRSERILRFMDDIYFFSDNLATLKADFARAQEILGLKGLSVNASKTKIGGMPGTDAADEQLSELKKRLLRHRRILIVSQYNDENSTNMEDSSLDDDEVNFVVDLLKAGSLTEEDAELILVVMRDHVDRIEQYLKIFASGFPHLAKNFCGLCQEAKDKLAVGHIVLDTLKSNDHTSEYQLFWFASMLESYLVNTELAPKIIEALYRHPNSTDITKAKILEISDQRFGLPEMREVFLREGRSDWMAWASAVGSRGMDKQARNYLLGYFKNGSAMNRLIAEIIQQD